MADPLSGLSFLIVRLSRAFSPENSVVVVMRLWDDDENAKAREFVAQWLNAGKTGQSATLFRCVGYWKQDRD